MMMTRAAENSFRVEGRKQGLLDILGDLFDRGETVSFTDKRGAYQAEQIASREVPMLRQVTPRPAHPVARRGHEVYTRRALAGYVQTAALGRQLDTRG